MKKILSSLFVFATISTSAFAQKYEQIVGGNLAALGGVSNIVNVFAPYAKFNPDHTHLISAVQYPVPAEDGFQAGEVYYIRLFQEEHKNKNNQTVQQAAVDIYLNNFGSLQIGGINVTPNAQPYIESAQ